MERLLSSSKSSTPRFDNNFSRSPSPISSRSPSPSPVHKAKNSNGFEYRVISKPSYENAKSKLLYLNPSPVNKSRYDQQDIGNDNIMRLPKSIVPNNNRKHYHPKETSTYTKKNEVPVFHGGNNFQQNSPTNSKRKRYIF